MSALTASETPSLKHPAETVGFETMTARVIEVGEVTAGIAVPERGGVRFYSSERSFDVLDGMLFRSFEQATRAARERTRQGVSLAARRGTERLKVA